MAYVRKSVREKQSNREKQNQIYEEQAALAATSAVTKMQKHKYVAYDKGEGPKAIVFKTDEVHYDMARKFCGGTKNVISTGFCHMIADEVRCYGESTSIGVKSRPDEDAELVKTFWS